MDPELSAATAVTLSALVGHILFGPDEDPPLREHCVSAHDEKIAEDAGLMPLGYYGWILYELPDRPIRIDIFPEGGYYRLVETELPHAATYARSWKYRRQAGLKSVIDAAMTWGGSAGSEPQGWAYRYDPGHLIIE